MSGVVDMKMYVFPRDDRANNLNQIEDRPLVNPAVDGAIVRLCTFMLAWSAGAGVAAFLALAG